MVTGLNMSGGGVGGGGSQSPPLTPLDGMDPGGYNGGLGGNGQDPASPTYVPTTRLGQNIILAKEKKFSVHYFSNYEHFPLDFRENILIFYPTLPTIQRAIG